MKSNPELSKFELYLAEVESRWSQSSALVSGRAFFELWENIHKPLPFTADRKAFLIQGQKLELPRGGGTPSGAFMWDDLNDCVSLHVENEKWSIRFLFRFPEGKVSVEETAPEFFQTGHLPDEHEAIYAVARKAVSIPEYADTSRLKRKEFLSILDSFASEYPPDVIARLKRLPLPDIRAKLRKVLADNAVDDFGGQLELPLFGTYARHEEPDENETFLNDWNTTLKTEPPWKTEIRLDLLLKTASRMLEFERDFTLSFRGAELVGNTEDKAVFRIPTASDLPVFPDDLLNVSEPPSREIHGVFQVDSYDGDQLIGHLPHGFAEDFAKSPESFNGRLQRSPSELYGRLLKQFRDDAANPTTLAAAGAILGTSEVAFSVPELPNPPDKLDRSQTIAWNAAVCASNPLVVIQGPPGTGKTHVLEKILRTLSLGRGQRLIFAASSHAAVDNLCRRIADLPYVRSGRNPENIAPDVREEHWIGTPGLYRKIREASPNKSFIYAGTYAGILKDDLLARDIDRGGRFDAILFDEAGMAPLEEILLCARFADRAILLGDHKQLPPFPRPEGVLAGLFDHEHQTSDSELRKMVSASALEWLVDGRKCPAIRLNTSYRCNNPRLLRFVSGLFYDAGIHPSPGAKYYRLPAHEREKAYPSATLRWVSTSDESETLRAEVIDFTNGKPAIWNPLETRLCAAVLEDMLKRHKPEEIRIISPYRLQIAQIGRAVSERFRDTFTKEEMRRFLQNNIATVDSFQGGESDAVIISYVRSNAGHGIGFIDMPNRINVAHTRCREELVIIGDLECLKSSGRNDIFIRLERAFRRDGEIIASTSMQTGRVTPPDDSAESRCSGKDGCPSDTPSDCSLQSQWKDHNGDPAEACIR